MYKTPQELLEALSAQNGGSIVCSGSCPTGEITYAQACGRWYVDDRNMGYVLRPATHTDMALKLQRLINKGEINFKGDKSGRPQ